MRSAYNTLISLNIMERLPTTLINKQPINTYFIFNKHTRRRQCTALMDFSIITTEHSDQDLSGLCDSPQFIIHLFFIQSTWLSSQEPQQPLAQEPLQPLTQSLLT